MNRTEDLRILFPTSFSDACFRTARAIAQMADTCRVGLDIVHIVKPGNATSRTRTELQSFMGEADHYDGCRRILVESDDAVQAIANLSEENHYDLIAAPASDRLGLHSFISPSFRARLLQKCCAPLWTAGACLDRMTPNRIRTIACLVDFEKMSDRYLPLAVAFASRMGARVHIVHINTPIDESTLARSFDSNAPLTPEAAMHRIRSVFAGRPCPEVHVAMGDMSSELPRLLKLCEADVAFVGPGQALQAWWRPRLSRCLDRLPCPVICVDGASSGFRRWTFQSSASSSDRRAVVSQRDHAFAD